MTARRSATLLMGEGGGDAPRDAATEPGVTEPAPITPSGDAKGSLTGYVLASKYRITRLLGEGGMGAVYEGEHLEIGKRVAIKVVHASFGTASEVAERFRREARAAAAVESEHIVQVFDVGHDPNLGLFMVMELLRGRDLSALLHEGGAVDLASACAVVAQAATGLEAAHAAGIVHRDLKPANLFLVPRADGTTLVKIVDFGVAKIRDARSETGAAITRVGSALGTPQYMAPEQAQGLPDIDLRVDVYALGCVLYEAACGRPAYGELPTYEQMIIQLVTTPTPRLRDVVADAPPALDALCAEMMHRDPAARPASMTVVLERLFAIVPAAAGPLVVAGLEPEGPRTSRVHPGAARGRLGSIPEAKRSAPAVTVSGGTAVAYDALETQGKVERRTSARRVAMIALGAAAMLGGAALAVKVARSTQPAATLVVSAPASSPPARPAVIEPPVIAPAIASVPPVVAPSASASAKPRPTQGPPPKPAAGSKVGSAGVAEQF